MCGSDNVRFVISCCRGQHENIEQAQRRVDETVNLVHGLSFSSLLPEIWHLSLFLLPVRRNRSSGGDGQ